MNGNKKSIVTVTKSFRMPSDFKLMDAYIGQNKDQMMEHIITMIEKGIKTNAPVIELFHFEGTNYCVTLIPREYRENLENIYKYYIQTEKYELCKRLKTVESLLPAAPVEVKK